MNTMHVLVLDVSPACAHLHVLYHLVVIAAATLLDGPCPRGPNLFEQRPAQARQELHDVACIQACSAAAKYHSKTDGAALLHLLTAPRYMPHNEQRYSPTNSTGCLAIQHSSTPKTAALATSCAYLAGLTLPLGLGSSTRLIMPSGPNTERSVGTSRPLLTGPGQQMVTPTFLYQGSSTEQNERWALELCKFQEVPFAAAACGFDAAAKRCNQCLPVHDLGCQRSKVAVECHLGPCASQHGRGITTIIASSSRCVQQQSTAHPMLNTANPKCEMIASHLSRLPGLALAPWLPCWQ